MSFFTRQGYGRMFLLLVLMAAVAVPSVSYAQATQNVPKIAVYVSGAEDPAVNKAMANGLITTLVNSGRYQAAENYKEFFEQAVEEQNGGAVPMKHEQIKKLGDQFGVRYVCIAEIVVVFGESQISARIVDVETGENGAMSAVGSQLKSQNDIANASEQIISEMLKKTQPSAQIAEIAPLPPSQTPQYIQETNPVQTVYEPSPQLPAKSKQIVSFGSGMFYANDYGGVKGVSIPMPNLGFGGYLFFDLIYVGRRCEAIISVRYSFQPKKGRFNRRPYLPFTVFGWCQ